MKPLLVYQAPVATRSGYGDFARDIIRHIIALDRFDIKIVSLPWGGCPMDALDPNDPKDKVIQDLIVPIPVNLPRKPEVFIQVSVPNEFQPIGEYSIGVTAGIETTVASPEWIEGCNRMNVIWTISNHSKAVFDQTRIDRKDHAGNVVQQLKVTTPVEVLHNCIDTSVFKRIAAKNIPATVNEAMKVVKEDFNFLFVGHWLKGNLGEDRKNVGVLIKTFCETFRLKSAVNQPGLILKTSGAGFSLMDQEDVLRKIRSIRASIGQNCPNVYLLHGDLTEEEMNGLYNHPKVKAHVSFTKGEGFGRPLLEATQSEKPVLCSGWSGVLDFLNPQDAILLGGALAPVEPGAVWDGVILKESQWFNVDPESSKNAFQYVYKHYDKFSEGAKRLAMKNKEQFAYDKIQRDTEALLDKYLPKFAMAMPLQLPKLKKIGA